MTPHLESAAEARIGRPHRRRRYSGLQRRKMFTAFGFLTPVLAFFVVLYFVPLAIELVDSLHSGAHTDEYVGLDNYFTAFSDPAVRNSMWVTLQYAVGVLVITIGLGFVLALILNRDPRSSRFFRGVLLIPYFTSIAIVGLLWRSILDPEVGVLNRCLAWLGLPEQSWLIEHPLATVTVVAAWQELGYTTLLFLAGMQSIPDMYYEAARIDGASHRQRLWYVTLPLLAPTTVFVSIIGVITALQQFALPYLLTNGGPADATDLYGLRVFDVAFTYRDFGYASALSYLLLVVILILSIIQLRVGRRRDE